MVKLVYTINGLTIKINGETATSGKHLVQGRTWEEALGKMVAILVKGEHPVSEGSVASWKKHLARCYQCEVANLDPKKLCGTGYGLLQPIKETL